MRNIRFWIVLAAVIAVFVLLGWWLHARQIQSQAKPLPSPATPASVAQPTILPPQAEKPSQPRTANRETETVRDLPVIWVQPDTVLAKVGVVAITLKDLTAVNLAVSTGQSFRADAYDRLLDKAIEREVIFQGAKARGVELTDAQKNDLENIRLSALARGSAAYTAPGYEAEAQAAFEVQDRSAQMLQNVLLNESGPPVQQITPAEIQAYYEAHQSEFAELPKNPEARAKVWQGIESEIQSRLIPEVYRNYEKKRQTLLDELQADIVIEKPASAGAP